jgi:uncharacterized RDD family membrane protein YckC
VLLVPALYASFFNGLGKQTIGKQLTGIAVVNSRTGSDQLHWCQPVVRSLVSHLNVFFMLDALWGAFQRDGRCLHDICAGTVVILRGHDQQ